jgi:hypothetical protein
LEEGAPIFNVVERDETPEEMEERKRIEEEQNKKSKKTQKKDETILDDEPKKVKQCVQSNISLNGVYPVMSRWIASCFQLIKDASITDVFTQEHLWNKIYP